MEFTEAFGDIAASRGVLPVETETPQVAVSTQPVPEAGSGENQVRIILAELVSKMTSSMPSKAFVVEAPVGVDWGGGGSVGGKAQKIADNEASTNLVVNEWSEGYGGSGDWGWSGGGGGDDLMGWDWGPGGNDWAGDGGGFNDGWVTDTDMQVVEIVGQRMTLWEKLEYDLNEVSTKVASVVDNAIEAFKDRGFVSVGYQNGLGVALTVDANFDVYVGVTAGRVGPSGIVGVGPEGVPISTYLTQWGVTAVTPIGVGMTGNDTGMGPAFGTPGFSVGYNQNVSQAWRDGHQFQDVVDEARWYFRDAHGLPP